METDNTTQHDKTRQHHTMCPCCTKVVKCITGCQQFEMTTQLNKLRYSQFVHRTPCYITARALHMPCALSTHTRTRAVHALCTDQGFRGRFPSIRRTARRTSGGVVVVAWYSDPIMCKHMANTWKQVTPPLLPTGTPTHLDGIPPSLYPLTRDHEKPATHWYSALSFCLLLPPVHSFIHSVTAHNPA